MVLNTCMKLYEHIFNGFKVKKDQYKRYGSCTLHAILVLNICMKFYEYILNSFKVKERTQFCQETAT